MIERIPILLMPTLGSLLSSREMKSHNGLMTLPGVDLTNLTSVTVLTTGLTYFSYVGRVNDAITTCDVVQNVTAAAVTITWAEVAIFKGVPVGNGNASLTRLGFTSVAATYNSTGRKKTTIALSGVTPGDDLWLAYGSAATTPFQVRAGLADDLQGGMFQTASVRPSTASSPQAVTLAGATVVPGAAVLVLP
jgi:hypothetical protein